MLDRATDRRTTHKGPRKNEASISLKALTARCWPKRLGASTTGSAWTSLSKLTISVLKESNGLDEHSDPLDKKVTVLGVHAYLIVVSTQISLDDEVIAIWWETQGFDVHQRQVGTLVYDLAIEVYEGSLHLFDEVVLLNHLNRQKILELSRSASPH